MTRRTLRPLTSWVALACAVVWGAACRSIGWEDYMEAGYDAYQDGRYVESEEMYLAAAERADAFDPRDPRRATTVSNLADLYVAQARPEEAELLYRQVVEMVEETLGQEHPELAVSLDKLAEFYADRQMYAEAEPLYERAVVILEVAYGRDHLDVAASLAGLAAAYDRQGYLAEAEPVYRRALVILETELGPENVRVADVLEDYAALLRTTNRDAQALELEARVRAIRSAP